MKNRLLATLLTFVAVPLFGNDATTPQPTNAELLTHLKTVEKEIKSGQQRFVAEAQELQEKYGKENYFFLLNMVNDIDQQLNNSLKKKLFNESALKEAFKSACNTETPPHLLLPTILGSLFVNTDCPFLTTTEKETALIKSIVVKHHEQYCQNNPNSDFIGLQVAELSGQISDNLFPFFTACFIEWLNELSKQIDAKIAELEAQPQIINPINKQTVRKK